MKFAGLGGLGEAPSSRLKEALCNAFALPLTTVFVAYVLQLLQAPVLVNKWGLLGPCFTAPTKPNPAGRLRSTCLYRAALMAIV